MNFDTVNMTVNYMQNADTSFIKDWLPTIIGGIATLIGAFGGTYLSNHFAKNEKKEMQKQLELNSLEELAIYLKRIFDILYVEYNGNFKSFYVSIANDNLDFPINIGTYKFLSNYSILAISLLNLLKNDILSIKNYPYICDHNEQVPQKLIATSLNKLVALNNIIIGIYKEEGGTLDNLFLSDKNKIQFNEEIKPNHEDLYEYDINKYWRKHGGQNDL